MRDMTLKSAVSIRFEEDISLRLRRVADRTGLTPADLVRRGTLELLDRTEQEGKLEAHRKYIDVQYVISGEEQMGYVPLNGQQILEPYKEENDIIFFTGEKSFIKVSSGMFAIFFPEDVHMPGIMTKQSLPVKKLVIKVRID